MNPERRSQGLWWDVGIGLVGGCSPVSPGCANCWRAAESHMRKNNPNPKIRARYAGLTDDRGRWTGAVRGIQQDLDKLGQGRKPKVKAIWNDLGHPQIGMEFRLKAFDRMEQANQHLFLVLTKRTETFLDFCFRYGIGSGNRWPENIWLGFTAENQEWFDWRWAFAKLIPAAKIFLSYEPALDPLILPPDFLDRGIDAWVIAGGETGSKARPSHPDWFRRVRDDCQAAGVPFWFKGWGEWIHETQYESLPRPFPACEINNGPGSRKGFLWPDGTWSFRLDKKAAGRVLDGRT